MAKPRTKWRGFKGTRQKDRPVKRSTSRYVITPPNIGMDALGFGAIIADAIDSNRRR